MVSTTRDYVLKLIWTRYSSPNGGPNMQPARKPISHDGIADHLLTDIAPAQDVQGDDHRCDAVGTQWPGRANS